MQRAEKAAERAILFGLRGAVYAVLTVGGLTACARPERINASCEWKDSVRIDDRSSARRRHIEEDVRVAQDLGIRYGDSVAGRVWDDVNRRARESCTDASLRAIMRQHSASRAELDAAVGARVWWPDVLLVFAPALLVFGAGSRAVVRGIASAYDSDDRLLPVIILVLLTPIAALIGVALGQIWSGFVEEARMRSNHLSFRGAYLPLYVYRPVALAVAAAAFGLIASNYRHHLGTGRQRGARRAVTTP